MPALLHIEELPFQKMNFKIDGDPMMVSNMIKTIMNEKMDVAGCFIAAIVMWCEDKGVDCGELKTMISFRP